MMEAAHRHSSGHGFEVSVSTLCGCFYCLEQFAPDEIRQWLLPEETAFCPRCGIDAVIGDRSGFPIREVAFLEAMRKEWLEGLN